MKDAQPRVTAERVSSFALPIVLPIVLLAVLLSGCQVIRTTTTSIYVPEHALRGSIYVAAANATLDTSVEFAPYLSRFEKKLAANGYSITRRASDAQFIALVAYGIDAGKTEIVSAQIFGQTAGGNSYPAAAGHGPADRYTMPSYGSADSSVAVAEKFTRAIAMDIVAADSLKSGTPRKIYEIRATSTGGCSAMAEVFDEMLEAMFFDFPGDSGVPRTVEVGGEFNC